MRHLVPILLTAACATACTTKADLSTRGSHSGSDDPAPNSCGTVRPPAPPADAGPSMPAPDARPEEHPELILARAEGHGFRIAMDETDLYWTLEDDPMTVNGSGGVASVAKTGGAVSRLATVLASGTDNRGVAVDERFVYFAHANSLPGGDAAILRVPRAGGEAEPLACVDNPMELVMDDAGIYFTANRPGGTPGAPLSGSAVFRLAKTGGTPVLLADGQSGGTDLALDSGWVYFTDSDARTVSRVWRGGGPVQVIATALGPTVRLAVDDSFVYFGMCTSGACDALDLERVLKDGSGPVTSLGPVGPMAEGFVATPERLYWVTYAAPDMMTIASMAKMGGPIDYPTGLLPGPEALVAEPDGSHVYWIDWVSGDVGRL